MYPAHLLSLFPPFARNHRVFVAMSFDHRFDARWQHVIVPAVASVTLGGVRLEAHRVDTRKVGDSILTEIVQGIAECRLVVADITSIGQIDGHPVRNGNVMYELGVAHAARLPEEVLLFRSDSDRLLFDVAGVRVNTYSPDDDPVAAKRSVAAALVDALREIDLRRSLAVRRAVDALGGDGLAVLFEAIQGIQHPPGTTMGEVLGNSGRRAALNRLLDLGVVASDLARVTPDRFRAMLDQPTERWATYHLTPFGSAVFEATKDRMGLTPDALREFTRMAEPSQPPPGTTAPEG